MVVPDHDLVDRVLRVGSAPDEGEYVAAEEHLDQSDAATRPEVAAEDLAEGIAVVDSEPHVGSDGEAAIVLVEREVEEVRNLGRGRIRVRVRVLGFVVGGD